MPAWNRSPNYLDKKIGTRGAPKPSILIVCEGEKTEPYYFESFKIPSMNVKIEGTGSNTDSLVEYTLKLMSEAHNDPYDHVWCVFDRDAFPAANITRAMQLARNNGIQIAFSNEAFELWYLLHFNYHDTAMSRDDFAGMLSRLMGREYRKNERGIYNLLKARQPDAIRNAERLLAKYAGNTPHQDNPSTTVHNLVKMLNRFANGDELKDELCGAIKAGNSEKIAQILRQDRTLVNVIGPEGLPAMHLAAKVGDAACLQALIAAGGNREHRALNDKNNTPLQAAVCAGRVATVRLLIGLGADVHGIDDEGDHALHSATFLGSVELVKLLLASGADRNGTNAKGESPLEIAKRMNNPELVDLLEEGE